MRSKQSGRKFILPKMMTLLLPNLWLLIILIITLYTDLVHKKIYNVMTIPGICVGIGINVLLWGWTGLGQSFLACLLGLFIFFIPFMMGGMGGGDVKLMAAIGATKGFEFVFHVALFSALVGGMMAVAILIWRKQFYPAIKKIFHLLFWVISFGHWPKPFFDKTSPGIPFGVAIVAGSVWTLWYLG